MTDGKKSEVSKDVSAFANSAGGTIVYGVLENGHVPTALDVGFDPSVISKEWLDQVINSRIQRRIDGVRIKPVELTTHPGRVAYVVSVPQSMRAPHQAAGKRFYKRFNFESVPMEEYEIRDVARRSEVPDLRMFFVLKNESKPADVGDAPSNATWVGLDPVITNDAKAAASYVVITLYVDAQLTLARVSDLQKTDRHERLVVNDQQIICYRLDMNWAVPGKLPVFEGVNFRIVDTPVPLGVPPGNGLYLLAWQVKSPGMAPKLRNCVLSSDGSGLKIIGQ